MPLEDEPLPGILNEPGEVFEGSDFSDCTDSGCTVLLASLLLAASPSEDELPDLRFSPRMVLSSRFRDSAAGSTLLLGAPPPPTTLVEDVTTIAALLVSI